MAIPVTCSGCDTPMDVPERLAGRSIRCKHCGQTFRIPAASSRSQRSSRQGFYDDDDPPTKQSSKTPVILIVAIVGLVGLVLVGGIVGGAIFFLAGDSEAEKDTVAEADSVRPIEPLPDRPQPRPSDPIRPLEPVDPRPNPPTIPPTVPSTPNQDESWKNLLKGPASPLVPVNLTASSDDDVNPFASLGRGWQLKPDTVEESAPLPADLRIVVPIPGNADDVLFPSTPSIHAALGDYSSPSGAMVSYDVTTKKPVGILRGPVRSTHKALSPDGTLLVQSHGKTVQVVAVPTAKPITQLDGSDNIDWVDFGPGDDTILVIRSETLELIRFNKDAGTAEVVTSTQMGGSPDDHGVAVSPARGAIAIADEKRIEIYETANLRQVGTRTLPERVAGLAFSGDGKELVAVYHPYGGLADRLIAWDVATGQITAAHQLPPKAVGEARRYQGSPIAYLSNHRDWLWWGNLIVEHDSGAVLTTLGIPKTGSFQERKVLPGNVILSVVESSGKYGLVGTPINQQGYDNLREAARKQLGRPEAEPAKVDTVKSIEPATDTSWSVVPSRVVLPTLRQVDLTGIPVHKKGLWMSGPTASKAALITRSTLAQPFPVEAFQLVRFDLSRGAVEDVTPLSLPAGLIDIDKWNPLGDLALEGDRFALCGPSNAKRVDVWVIGREGPHEIAIEMPEEVKHLSLISRERLLTLLENGEVVCWDASTGNGVYRCANRYDSIALGPQRRWMAGFREDGFDLIDLSTGERRGRLETGPAESPSKTANYPSYTMAAFHPEGSRLATVVSGGEYGQTVSVWDLKSGQRTHHFPTRPLGREELVWVGDDCLLQGGNQLIDLKVGDLVWSFLVTRGYTRAETSLDGRFWYLGYVKNANNAGSRIDLIGTDLTPTIARQGQRPNAVELVVNVGDQTSAQEARDYLARQLQGLGYQIRSGAPVRVEMTATMGTKEWRVGFQETVTTPRVEGKVRMIGPDGSACYEREIFGDTGPIRSERTRELTDQESQAWQQFRRNISLAILPRQVVISGGQAIALPGRSSLSTR